MEPQARAEDAADSIRTWLSGFLTRHNGVSGTAHIREKGGLRLLSAANIPEKVRDTVAWAPSGKGMAGLALERGVPIETCNLKEDNSGAVKPGARAVDALAAVAIPIKAADGTVRAVVGIAFADERRFSPGEIELLTKSASTLP